MGKAELTLCSYASYGTSPAAWLDHGHGDSHPPSGLSAETEGSLWHCNKSPHTQGQHGTGTRVQQRDTSFRRTFSLDSNSV